MQHFKYLVRTKLAVILSGQASRQNFGLPFRFKLLCLPLYFITNETLLNNVYGLPLCAGHLNYVYKLAFFKKLDPINSIISTDLV